MEIKIVNVKISVAQKTNLKSWVCRKYNIEESNIEEFRILRQAIDARKRNQVVYDYQFYLRLKSEMPTLLKHSEISLYISKPPVTYPQWKFPAPPVIVGFGPAGMFAALYLARCGAKPIVIERGSCIEQRKKEVEKFMKTKELDENSNIQFGEGGAGAFSDGKLTTNVSNEWVSFIFEEFYKHGATEDVTYMSQPHVGTDYLEKVVKNIREEIISLGGIFYFNTQFIDVESAENREVVVKCTQNKSFTTRHLLLCLGHSARDTIRMLYEKGVAMEAKSFSMGVRIEHLQTKINTAQYGDFAKFLPAASYKGVVHLKERSVYTFCMCPGGTVMASASEKNTILTNGMSLKNRAQKNANSAFLVNVTPDDFYKDSPLDGMDYQAKYERAAFETSRDYRAPANLVGEFLQDKVALQARTVKPSYPHGVHFCDLSQVLPAYVVNSLREAIPLMDRKLHGFADPDAVLTGVETRSSSPVRILRGENRQCNLPGVYPVGEGAGYAGGITSAALDGLKTAFALFENID